MTLKEMIANDITNVFLANEDEFSEYHDIGQNSSDKKYHVIASLQANEITNSNLAEGSPLQKVSHTLLVATYVVENIKEGQIIYIDDKPYKVVSALHEMGLSTVYLEKGSDKRTFGK